MNDEIKTTLAHPVVQEGWCDGCNPDNCSGCATPTAPVDADLQKQDEALIRQMLEALECSGEPDDPGHRCSHCDDYVDRNSVLRNAARKRLEAVGADGVEPLTDSQIADIYFEALGSQHLREQDRKMVMRFARAVESEVQKQDEVLISQMLEAQAAAPIKNLEEAIAHAEDKAKGNSACAMEHAKLAAWLTELQLLRAAQTATVDATVQQDAERWKETLRHAGSNGLELLTTIDAAIAARAAQARR